MPYSGSPYAGAPYAGSSTQSFARTATDAALASDVARANVALARTASDSAISGDTASRAPLDLTRTATDAALSGDTAQANIAVTRTAADASLASDSARGTLAAMRAAADVALTTDSARANVALVAIATDSALTTDSARANIAATRTAADTSLTTDTVTGFAAFRVFDSALTTDVARANVTVERTAVDVAVSTDTARAPDLLPRTAHDTALTTDTARANVNLRFAFDYAFSADFARRLVALGVTASDAAVSTDTAGAPAFITRTAADAALLGDVATATGTRARTAADTSYTTDSAVGLVGPVVFGAAHDTALTSDTARTTGLVLHRTAADVALTSDSTGIFTTYAQDVAYTTDVAICIPVAISMSVAPTVVVWAYPSFKGSLPTPVAVPGQSGLHEYEVIVCDSNGVAMGQIVSAVPTQIDWELDDLGQALIDCWIFDPSWGNVSGALSGPGLPVGNALLPPQTIPGGREIQIWRDHVLIWWGTVTGVTFDKSQVHLTCSGFLWYFQRRFFGPNPANMLINGGFETGDFTGWVSSAAGVIRQIVGPGDLSSLWLEGNHSALLGSPSDGIDSYIYQYVPFTTGAGGATFDLSAWVLIPNYAPPFHPSFGQFGLYMEVIVDETVQPGSPQYTQITASTAAADSQGTLQNQWTRLDCQVDAPPNVSGVIQCRLYALPVGAFWDAVQLTQNLAVGMTPDLTPPTSGALLDVTDIMANVVAYSTDPTWGKSSLTFDNGTGSPFVGGSSGVSLQRLYPLSDNTAVLDALNEFPTAGILDFEVVWDSTGHFRWFEVFTPAKGQMQYNYPLDMDQGTITDLEGTLDGTAVGTSQRVLGQGSSGSSEDIGFAAFPSYLGGRVGGAMATVTAGQNTITTTEPFFLASDVGQPVYLMPDLGDYSAPVASSNAPPQAIPVGSVIGLVFSPTFAAFTTPHAAYSNAGAAVGMTGATIGIGGVILENSQSAIPNLPVSTLQGTAYGTLIQQLMGTPIPAPRLRADGAGGMFGNVKTGDVIPVRLDYGWLQSEGTLMRVIGQTLYPPTEELALTLNVVNGVP